MARSGQLSQLCLALQAVVLGRLHQQSVELVVALRKLAARHGRGRRRRMRRGRRAGPSPPPVFPLTAFALGLLALLRPSLDVLSSGESRARSSPAAPPAVSPRRALRPWPAHGVQRCAGCSCPPRIPRGWPHRAGSSPPSPGRFPPAPATPRAAPPSVGQTAVPAILRGGRSRCSTKRFNRAAFCRKYPAGRSQPLQLFQRRVANSRDGQDPRPAQIPHRPFHIRPGRILGQIRAHNHLEGRTCRPPMLRPHGVFQLPEKTPDLPRLRTRFPHPGSVTE